MVFYFKCDVVEPPITIYMGRDKYENEELIKHGVEDDIWFHVDKMSSAHVYCRIPFGSGLTIDNLPKELLIDCAQLTKANSIEGNKKDNITIVYTPWRNLKKDQNMAVGQVSFHIPKRVKRTFVQTRDNAIVRRLLKTRVEKYPDLAKEKVEFENQKAQFIKEEKKQQEEIERLQKEAEEAGETFIPYDNAMKSEFMRSNRAVTQNVQEFEDDFM